MPSTPAHWWIARKLILQCYFIFCSQLPILSFFQQRVGRWGKLWSLFPQFLSLYTSSYLVLLSLITLQKSGRRRAQLWDSVCCTNSTSTQNQSTQFDLKHGSLPGASSIRWDLQTDGLWLLLLLAPLARKTLNGKVVGHFSSSSSSWGFQSPKWPLQLGRKQIPLTSPGWCMEVFQRRYLAGRSQTDLATCFSLLTFHN